jgi:hypothetical protein
MLKRYEGSLAETNRPLNELVRGLRLPLEPPGPLWRRRSRAPGPSCSPRAIPPSRTAMLAQRLGTPVLRARSRSRREGASSARSGDNAITGRDIHPRTSRCSSSSPRRPPSPSTTPASTPSWPAVSRTSRPRRTRRAAAKGRRGARSAVGDRGNGRDGAHDIRNPLVAIGGFARPLWRTAGQATPEARPLDVIVEEVIRLEGIVTRSSTTQARLPAAAPSR